MFKSKIKVTEKTPDGANTKNVKRALPLIFGELLKFI